jgi:hypothetical protein
MTIRGDSFDDVSTRGRWEGFMNAIRSGRTLTTAIALLSALLAGAAQAYTPEQQQACTGDAFRLCGSEIPNVDRVKVCMIRNRALLSAGCRVYFRSHEPAASPALRTRRSARIVPATAHYPATARPRGAKKPARAAGAT